MKRLYCWMPVMLCIIMMGSTVRAAEQPVPEELRRQVLENLVAIEDEGLMSIMLRLRESGASYIPEITTPVDVDKYQDPEKQRVMVGVTLTNMAYAAAFNQPKQAAEYAQAVFRLLDTLGFPWPEMERRFVEAVEKLDEPGGEQRIMDLIKEIDADKEWQEMLGTHEGMGFMTGVFYGSVVEGIFLAVEIAVLSGYDPAFLQFVRDEYTALLAIQNMLLLFEGEPEPAGVVNKDERMGFIAGLIDVVGDVTQIGREQVDALRPVITKERNAMVH